MQIKNPCMYVCMYVCMQAYPISNHIPFGVRSEWSDSRVVLWEQTVYCLREERFPLPETAIAMNSHVLLFHRFFLFCRCLAKLLWAVPSFDSLKHLILIVRPRCVKNKITSSIIFISYHTQTHMKLLFISCQCSVVQYRELFECS
jgi:hypothetical protein